MKSAGLDLNNLTTDEIKQLVIKLAQNGRTLEARQACTGLCAKSPNDTDAWHLLGAVHGSLQDYPSAETCCRRALALGPNRPTTMFNLAVALAKQGKNLEAIDAFNRCIQLSPGYADAWHELANTQSSQGGYLSAIPNYKKAIQLQPDCALYHFNLGISHQHLKQLAAATGCYQKTIELEPGHYDAYMELAAIYRHNQEYKREIDTLQKAARHFPDDVALLFKLGSAYRNNGESSMARQYFEKTILLDQGHIGALTGIAEYLGLEGKYDEARNLLDKILAKAPDNAPTVILFAHYALGTDRTQEAIDLIIRALKNEDLADSLKSNLHTSLADLYESQGNLDLAFRHYETGKRLRGEKFEYRQVKNTFLAAMTLFSPDNLSRLPCSDNTSTMPVFIIGMPRSGTTLTEQILASHPDVYGAGELTTISDLAKKLPEILGTGQQYFLSLEGLTSPVLNNLADEYLNYIQALSHGEPYVTDKLPSNFMHLGLIELLFPKARVIHCTRDPLDTCLSCYFKNLRGQHPYANNLTDLGHFYRLYQQLMAHWVNVLTLPIHEVKYENLVMDQENETRRLLEFCNLDWNDACLQFHKTQRTVATASHNQVRSPMYTKSISRWRAYEKHLGPLFESLNLTRH